MNTTASLIDIEELLPNCDLRMPSQEEPNPALVIQKSQEARAQEAQLKARVENLQRAEWELKLSQLDQLSKREIKERELLLQQVRHAEEKNASLTRQFNELYQYCESLYQDADQRRKAAEERLIQSQNEISTFARRFEEQQKRIEAVVQETKEAKQREERIAGENIELINQIHSLNQQLDERRGQRAISLSSLERGKDFIQSSIRSLGDFYESFETYLESVEKNGITPITQRTGKLFIEHWKIQQENLQASSRSLNDLLDEPPETD